MKGIILNLLQTVTEEVHGEQVWDEVLTEADVLGIYTALGNYPDAEVVAIVEAIGRRTGRTPGEVLQWFGRAAMPHLQQRYPGFFTPPDPVTFVTTLDDVIHGEVRKLYPGALPPVLGFSDVTPTEVTIDYRSDRRMADLAVGFLHGAAAAYGHTVEVERTDVDVDGTHVVLRCRFAPP